MTRHMIVEIVLLIFCTMTVIAAYACCVVAGECSRMEEKAATAKSTPPMIGKGGNNDGYFNDTL